MMLRVPLPLGAIVLRRVRAKRAGAAAASFVQTHCAG